MGWVRVFFCTNTPELLNQNHKNSHLLILGSCPAPLAVGETASGKSTCLRLIQCLPRGIFLSQSSAESVATELVRSTLPVYWDDPARPKTFKKVLVSTFLGGGKQTKTSGDEVPLTTFLITVNFTLDDDMIYHYPVLHTNGILKGKERIVLS